MYNTHTPNVIAQEIPKRNNRTQNTTVEAPFFFLQFLYFLQSHLQLLVSHAIELQCCIFIATVFINPQEEVACMAALLFTDAE